MPVVEDEAGRERVEAPAPRPRKGVRWKRLARVLLLLLLLWLPLAWIAARALIVSARLEQADVIVVLGGSSTYVERTREAARLLKSGRASKILLTNDGQQGGWSSELQRNPYFVERASAELEREGVPAEQIEVLPQLVASTYDEARLLREYAVRNRLRSVLVVTSAYHSRRALWTMRRAFDGTGIHLGLESPPPGLQTPRPATWWLSRQGWHVVAGEYVKLAYYWFSY